jgi:hypothetical protein
VDEAVELNLMTKCLISLSDLSVSYRRKRGGQEKNEIALAWW